MKPDARLVDITVGEGARVFDAFGQSEDLFAEHFGIDILRYRYGTEAFVVKNGLALGRARGKYRDVIRFPELMARAGAAQSQTDVRAFFRTARFSGFTDREVTIAAQSIPSLSDAFDFALPDAAVPPAVLLYLSALEVASAERDGAPPLVGGRRRKLVAATAARFTAFHTALLTDRPFTARRVGLNEELVKRLLQFDSPRVRELLESALDKEVETVKPILGFGTTERVVMWSMFATANAFSASMFAVTALGNINLLEFWVKLSLGSSAAVAYRAVTHRPLHQGQTALAVRSLALLKSGRYSSRGTRLCRAFLERLFPQQYRK